MCLGCARLCTKDEAIAHARADDAHSVFADVERAELFCAPCGVHVYSRDFDRAVLGIRAVAARVEPSGENHDVSDEKRRRIATRIAARDSNPPPLVPGDATLPSVNSAGVPRGVRGIANLGNTCFLSTVLQATIRAPTVGGFFLADGHNRYLCASDRARRVAAAVARGVEPDLEDEYCLACELDELVSEAYSGSDEPMVPSEFLHAWWRQVPEHLARHRQQDAHEFFLSLVATVHSNLTPGERRSRAAPGTPRAAATSPGDPGTAAGTGTGTTGTTGTPGSTPRASAGSGGAGLGMEWCDCPMHRAFAGTIRSDVTCGACGHTSTVHDPTVGLSLDLPVPGSGGARGAGTTIGPALTLEGCLRQFCRPERLGEGESFPCARCGDAEGVKTKQMSLRRAPTVLTLHLKRFDHAARAAGGAAGETAGRKIDAHVAFPFELVMGPYASSAALRARFGNRSAGEWATAGGDRYDLFAVVVHSGGMDSGHYIAYVQWQGAWFRCDDHQVSRADPVTVAAAQAYLLFYHARPAEDAHARRDGMGRVVHTS